MTDADIVHIGVQAMIVSAKLAMPVLLTALAIGFVISLFQAVTQVQEVTLSFVPKLLGVALVLVVAGHWMLQEAVSFTRAMFDLLPQLLT
ncbi:flagellar biosynthesis protein FliQ [Phycicoccus sp. MAQZ13P-2]|uniref:flagellar biosynthesis protein FliQ n=1 Tax=Phycicoccus TaxID=367298 RepID=UPI0004C3719F|nr:MULTISPECIES: flagellar biosynthesis protein FliQ [Phycicoccus]MBT9254956.1 flagellar biosynthesis protein FliQ [Phycicoccus mangrovi]MBT9256047.1 flagellar biosynthesis protein FliQ [Phycicoccus mangrovi]MBT9273940.1 flagellar biosynthesis protein FliQ [Phycicoccus mangrovi]GIL36739.1 flagellar export apparatus protein FliQ [Phycicoccus sp. DTK01]